MRRLYFQKKLIFLFLILACVHKASGQNMDSLRQVLRSTEKPDSSKVFAYASLSRLYQEINVDSAVYFANQGLQLANQKHFNKGAGACMNVLAFACMKRNDPEKALDYSRKALREFEIAGYSYGEVTA